MTKCESNIHNFTSKFSFHMKQKLSKYSNFLVCIQKWKIHLIHLIITSAGSIKDVKSIIKASIKTMAEYLPCMVCIATKKCQITTGGHK